MLKFDHDSHLYTMEGVEVPSVTQILKAAGAYSGAEFFRPEHATRGEIVHLATLYYDQNDLAEGSLEDQYVGYLEAYKKWRKEFPITITSREYRVFHETLWYAGTVDIIAHDASDKAWIIDIKTGDPGIAGKLQTAAYAMAYFNQLSEEELRDVKRACVRLGKEGTYMMYPYSNASDYEAWTHALKWVQWRDHGRNIN